MTKIRGIFFILSISLLLTVNIAYAADIKVESISPIKVFADEEVEFSVETDLDSGVSINEYTWQFGDETSSTTTTDSVNHTYSKAGTYKLKIKASSDDSSDTKTFSIVVYSSKNSINLTIVSKFQDIENTKEDIEEKFSNFFEETINSVVDFEELEKELDSISEDYQSASSDEEFFEIWDALNEIKIPKTIFVSESLESSLYYPKEENIDLEIVKDIEGGNYNNDDKEKYISAVYEWNNNNLETKIEYEEISFQYINSSEPIVKFFTIRINEAKDISYDYYLIIKDINDLTFEKDYSETEESGYYYINGKDGQTISFSTTEDVDFIDIPAFISPSLSKLDIGSSTAVLCDKNGKCEEERGENWKNCSDCESERTKIIIYSILGVLLIGLIIYIIMRLWYKSSYEGHLFKNRNNLHNLLTYIHNAKRQGLNDQKMRSSLKKAGWKSEQITFALKKYSGKRTGLP